MTNTKAHRNSGSKRDFPALNTRGGINKNGVFSTHVICIMALVVVFRFTVKRGIPVYSPHSLAQGNVKTLGKCSHLTLDWIF